MHALPLHITHLQALIIMSKPRDHPDPGIPAVFVSEKAGIIMRKLITPGQTRVRIVPVSLGCETWSHAVRAFRACLLASLLAGVLVLRCSALAGTVALLVCMLSSAWQSHLLLSHPWVLLRAFGLQPYTHSAAPAAHHTFWLQLSGSARMPGDVSFPGLPAVLAILYICQLHAGAAMRHMTLSCSSAELCMHAASPAVCYCCAAGVWLCVDEPGHVSVLGLPRPHGGAGHLLRDALLERVAGPHTRQEDAARAGGSCELWRGWPGEGYKASGFMSVVLHAVYLGSTADCQMGQEDAT
jgi:hypothetical protein